MSSDTYPTGRATTAPAADPKRVPVTGPNRATLRRWRYAQDSGMCGTHDLPIKRGTGRCMRCRKLARGK